MVNPKLIQDLLLVSKKRLTGDWVLLGGTLLYYFNISKRVTTDIDLVPISGTRGNQQMLQAFELSNDLNLPVETINSAALFFLEKIKNYRDELVLIQEWKEGKIYRPNLYLFIRLKLGRFTESDYLDCMEVLALPLPEKNRDSLIKIQEIIALERDNKKNGEEKTKLINTLLKQVKKEINALKS